MFTKSQSDSKWFYEKTNSLHERFQKCEALAADFEQKMYSKEDDYKLSTEMFKSKDLQGYWYKVVADGERSKTRNMKILEKIALLDRLMHSLGTKTERLDILRDEYVNITLKLQSLGNTHPLWETNPNVEQIQNPNVSKSHVSQHWLESVTESGLGSSCAPSRSLQHGWTQTDQVCCPHCSNYIFEESSHTDAVESETNRVYPSHAIAHLESMFSGPVTTGTSSMNRIRNFVHHPDPYSSGSADKLRRESVIPNFSNDLKYEHVTSDMQSQNIIQNSARDVPVNRDMWDYSKHESELAKVPVEDRSHSYGKESNYKYENETVQVTENKAGLHQTNSTKEFSLYQTSLATEEPNREDSFTKSDNQEVENIEYDIANSASQLQKPQSGDDAQNKTKIKYDDDGIYFQNQMAVPSSNVIESLDNFKGNNEHENYPSQLKNSQPQEYINDNLERENPSVIPLHSETNETCNNDDNNNNNNNMPTTYGDSPFKEHMVLNTVNSSEHFPPAQAILQDAISISPDSSISYHQLLDLENKELEAREKNITEHEAMRTGSDIFKESSNFGTRKETSLTRDQEYTNVAQDIALLRKGDISDKGQSSEVRLTKSSISADADHNNVLDSKDKQSDFKDLAPAAPVLTINGGRSQLNTDRENGNVDKKSLQRKLKRSNDDSSDDSTCMDDVEDSFFDNDPPMMKDCNAYRALLGIQAQHKESDSEDDIENKFVQSVMSKESRKPDPITSGDLVTSSSKTKVIPSVVLNHTTSSSSDISLEKQDISSPKKMQPVEKKAITAQDRNRIKKKVLLLGQGFDSDLEESVKSLEKEPCETDDDFFD